MKKTMLKTLSIALAAMLLTTSMAFAATVPTDVSGKPYEEAVTALMEKEIITGDVDGLFHPEQNLTRAQACKIVISAINPPSAELAGTATQQIASSGFSDLTGYGWATDYINYAAATGITTGYPDGTFKPGNKVTIAEMTAFIVRACGYTNETVGGVWPENYIEKAYELNLYDGMGFVTENDAHITAAYATGTPAQKWQMAGMAYNALESIEKAHPEKETPPQGTDKDKVDGVPDAAAMTFVNAGFNESMSTFDGKTISGDVKVYTYGVKKDYNATMKFANKVSDYRLDTVYKYKNVKTPAWYKLENGKITEMIVPMDVGFSGKAYGVINGTVSTLGSDSKAVTGFNTLTALQKITWLYKDNSSVALTGQFDGEIYELVVDDGEVQSVNTAATPAKNSVFKELETTGTFTAVTSYKDRVITLDGGRITEIRSNASVYVLSDDQKSYKAGSLSSIREGGSVRLYDISDDDYSAADIVVVK